MSLDNIKNSFIKHITDKIDKNIFGNFNPDENMSLFEYFAQFNDYLAQNGNFDTSLFSFSTYQIESIVKNINQYTSGEGEVKDKSIEGYLNGEKEILGMYELYSEIFQDETVKNLFDSDADGELSEEEMIAAFNNISSIDGVDKEVSLKDFAGLSSYIQNFIQNNPELEGKDLTDAILKSINALDGDGNKLSASDFQILGQEVDDANKLGSQEPMTPDQLAQQVAQTVSGSVPSVFNNNNFNTGSGTMNTHSSNYKGPSGELKSMELAKAVEAQDGEIASLENQIAAQNEAKAKALGASAEYFAENNYEEKLGNLNTLISNINNYNSTITSAKSELHTTQYDLNAAKVELDNLQDPVVFDEYQEEINNRREELKTQISDLEQKEQNLQTKIKENEDALKKAETDRTALETEIKTIEDNNPDAESKAAIAQYNQTIQELQEKITAAKSKKQSAETTLNTQREQEIKDSDVYGKALAYRQSEFVKFMMDYATDPATKRKYDEWHAKNKGAYCAVFTSEVSEIMYAKVLDKLGIDPKSMKTFGDQNSSTQGLTGDQMAMAASAWGDKIQPALDALGLNTQGSINIQGMSEEQKKNLVREGKIYPGMTFEYNDGYHTGFVESINKDLSWNTIEGNTSVKYDDGKSESGTVGSHKRDATNPRLYALTDSTLKALIWAYQAGRITKEQMQAMTYSAHFNA